MNNKIFQVAVVLSLIAAGFFGLMLITRVIARKDLHPGHGSQPTSQRSDAER